MGLMLQVFSPIVTAECREESRPMNAMGLHPQIDGLSSPVLP